MFSQHEFLLNRGYFVIPELNIKTSSYNAVFAQIIVKLTTTKERPVLTKSLLLKP